jgi:hypothetical protein
MIWDRPEPDSECDVFFPKIEGKDWLLLSTRVLSATATNYTYCRNNRR